jgi:tetratricopeptide (TPR) repeat protein
LRRRILLARPVPAPPPPKKPPSPGTLAAVKAFEAALKLFNKHDFAGARHAFDGVMSKFGDEAEVTSRVRTYLAICEQRLARTPAAPRNPDALYDQGVFELNRGSVREAITLFEKAIKANPRADHVFYSLAAAFARSSELNKALEALRRAVALSAVHKAHARRDLDFLVLRTNEDFQQLIGFDFELVEE